MPLILVIDDDEQMRRMIRTMLERAGYDVLEAADGRIGMKLFRQAPTDLVITDIVMPEMEGLETIMALKRESPPVKIIAISGGARMQPGDYLIVAKELGAHRTLTKPFRRHALLEAVKELLAPT